MATSEKNTIIGNKFIHMQVSTSNPEIFFSPARELFEEMVSWLGSDTVYRQEEKLNRPKPIGKQLLCFMQIQVKKQKLG